MKIIQLSDPHLMTPGGILYGSDPSARLDASWPTSARTMPMPNWW